MSSKTGRRHRCNGTGRSGVGGEDAVTAALDPVGQQLAHDRRHGDAPAVVAERRVNARGELVQVREMVERERDLAAPHELPLAARAS